MRCRPLSHFIKRRFWPHWREGHENRRTPGLGRIHGARAHAHHEKRKPLTQLTDRLPLLARGALYVLAILAIAVFGIWGPGYSAQAFIYFQF